MINTYYYVNTSAEVETVLRDGFISEYEVTTTGIKKFRAKRMKSKPIMPEYKPAVFDVSRLRGLTSQQIVWRVFEARNVLDAFIPCLSLSWDFEEADERLDARGVVL